MKLTLPPFSICIALALAGGFAHADTIKLKDGKVIEGTITAESASSVTIKYMLTPKIPDFKTIPRSDIASVEKKTPEDTAADEIKKLIPTEDFLEPSDYRRMIAEGPAKFLATYPASKYRAEIDGIKKTFEDELNKTLRSNRKVDGEWLSGDQLQAYTYNIEALKKLRAMEKAIKAEDHRGALIAFSELEEIGKLSISYPKAIPMAKEVADQYSKILAAAVKAVPQKIKDAEDRLSKMNPTEVPRAKAEREKAKKDFQALIAQQKKDKVKFTSTMDIDLPSLTEASNQVAAEIKRLEGLNAATIKETAEGYDKILKLIGQKKYEEASLRLDDFIKTSREAAGDPAIKRQQEDLKRLREEAQRAAQQRELLERTQPKPQ